MADKPSDPDDKFTFHIPPGKKPDQAMIDKAESDLLARQRECYAELEKVQWQLAYFYSYTGRPQLALGYVERLASITEEPEKKALLYLTMGQLMEQSDDCEAAILFYTQAFSLEPAHSDVWYLINNNLGFCLNTQGDYAAAEPYCRAAIKIDPVRHNAHKNLGLSLAGQGRYAEAVRSLITAVKRNPSDPRALVHLEELTAQHPEVFQAIEDLPEQIRKCREAVKLATLARESVEQESQDDESSTGATVQ
jgi:tetratricopeptide (TPR) repeat protein